MEKTYNLFKKFIPIIILLSFLGLIFGIFSLIYYYNDYTISISFGNVIPIFAISFAVLAIVAYVILVIKTPTIHIKRLKKDLGFSKFAAALAAALVTALFLFDFIKFILPSTSLMTLKIVRLPVTIPFIIYFILELVPSKLRRKKINIPSWLPPICSLCAIAWCVIGLLSIYFWSGEGSLPTTNIFKLLHMLYYAVAILFFLSEMGFSYFAKGHRFFIIASFTLFVVSFVSTGSVMIGMFFNLIPSVTISEFEVITAFTLGIYALSKMLSVPYTIKYVISREGSRHHQQHHHHHHHSKQKAAAGVAKSDIPNDIDI